MTPKYQDSVACKDELTYAKERGVCIIPIRLVASWKPTGWLGFTITGHKWIDFRDTHTNIDLPIQQLIMEIQMLVGNKLDCFQVGEQDFDPDSYYRLTTQCQGDDKCLDVVNDGKNNNQLMLAETSDCTQQYWKITQV